MQIEGFAELNQPMIGEGNRLLLITAKAPDDDSWRPPLLDHIE
jgi:hypothetical protein